MQKKQIGKFMFELYDENNDKTAVVVAANTRYKELNISDYVEGYRVVSIGPYAFHKHPRLKKIVLPDTLERIDSMAFSDCLLLEEVEIASVHVEVMAYAFYNCKSLKKISGLLLETQHAKIFENCENLREADCVFSGVYNSNVFKNCEKLEVLKFADGVDLWDVAFENCRGLREIHLLGKANIERNFLEKMRDMEIHCKESCLLTEYAYTGTNVIIEV